MKKHFSLGLIFALILVAVLSGCGGGSGGNKGNGGTTPVVYIAGYYNDDDGDQACYWTGETPTLLDDSGQNSRANSIFVSSGNVYIAGYYTDTKRVACYWTNSRQNRTSLSDGTGFATANSIYFYNNNVYVAGKNSNQRACFWQNDQDHETVLENDTTSEAKAIFVSSSGIYVAGNIGTNPTNAYYWRDDGLNRTTLTDGNNATSVFVAGDGTVYTAGRYTDFLSHTHACFWINGDKYILNSITGYSEARSIYVKDGIAYIAGSYAPTGYFWSQPCYWTVSTGAPNQPTHIPLDMGPDYGCSASAIFVSANGDVYTAGHYHDNVNGGPVRACYWINQNQTPVILDNSTRGSWPTSIFVK